MRCVMSLLTSHWPNQSPYKNIFSSISLDSDERAMFLEELGVMDVRSKVLARQLVTAAF
jgi:hypothetical protein